MTQVDTNAHLEIARIVSRQEHKKRPGDRSTYTSNTQTVTILEFKSINCH